MSERPGSPSDAAGPTPGWYDDPGSEGERWWDGDRWTEHVRAAGSDLTAPSAGRYPLRYALLDRWRILLAGALAIAVIAVGAVIVLGGGGSTSGGAEEQAVSQTVDGFLSAVAKGDGKGCRSYLDASSCGFVSAIGERPGALEVGDVSVEGDEATVRVADSPIVIHLSQSGGRWAIERADAQVAGVER